MAEWPNEQDDIVPDGKSHRLIGVTAKCCRRKVPTRPPIALHIWLSVSMPNRLQFPDDILVFAHFCCAAFRILNS